MDEKPSGSEFKKLEEVGFLEKSLDKVLEIKIGVETSLEEIKEIAEPVINKSPIKFIITADYSIWLSDKTHYDILHKNGLFLRTYVSHVEGYCRPQDKPPVVKFYQHSDRFNDVFKELKEKFSMPEDEFNDLCEGVARKKILEFLTMLSKK